MKHPDLIKNFDKIKKAYIGCDLHGDCVCRYDCICNKYIDLNAGLGDCFDIYHTAKNLKKKYKRKLEKWKRLTSTA